MATETLTQTTSTPQNLNTNPYEAARTSLERDGFVVLPASLFPSFDLDSLRTAAKRMTASAREGKWPYIRTLPKQFPPWPADPSNGIWGVQHLMHPSNPDNLTFAASYFDPELIEYVRALIGCEKDDLVMELYNMLVRPDKDFALRWHRDDIAQDATAEQEMERLGQTSHHAQWNLSLYDDASLIVVPGTHKRARTEEERNADPYEDNMPGQMVVKLKAGEVIFYNNNILHRGKYDSTVERMTLHGSMGITSGSTGRAMNVLQHGVGAWAEKYDFEGLNENLRPTANAMRERLVEMGRKSGDVGYFSKDE